MAPQNWQKNPINYKNITMKNGTINLYKKIWLGLKMFTNLSTSINDISFVDFINLLVSMDTIIILNVPPFSSVFCVKNPQIYVRNPWKLNFHTRKLYNYGTLYHWIKSQNFWNNLRMCPVMWALATRLCPWQHHCI